MDGAAALEEIATGIDAILSRFEHTRDGLWIAQGDQAKFTGLVLEARHLIESLGLNNFALEIENARVEGTQNYTGSQSYHSVEQAASIVRSAVRVIRRKNSGPLIAPIGGETQRPYVNFGRIEELRSTPSEQWDLQRLVRMCEELNSTFFFGNYLASAMLLRAILDHVPPVFSASSFSQFVATIPGKSIKKSMERLEKSARHISDTWLHQQIRQSESLPTFTGVDYRQELDFLLGEIVRTLRAPQVN